MPLDTFFSFPLPLGARHHPRAMPFSATAAGASFVDPSFTGAPFLLLGLAPSILTAASCLPACPLGYSLPTRSGTNLGAAAAADRGNGAKESTPS